MRRIEFEQTVKAFHLSCKYYICCISRLLDLYNVQDNYTNDTKNDYENEISDDDEWRHCGPRRD